MHSAGLRDDLLTVAAHRRFRQASPLLGLLSCPFYRGGVPRIRSAPWSPIIMLGLAVLPVTQESMIEASITRSLPTPWTCRLASTTALALSEPIRHEPTKCW